MNCLRIVFVVTTDPCSTVLMQGMWHNESHKQNCLNKIFAINRDLAWRTVWSKCTWMIAISFFTVYHQKFLLQYGSFSKASSSHTQITMSWYCVWHLWENSAEPNISNLIVIVRPEQVRPCNLENALKSTSTKQELPRFLLEGMKVLGFLHRNLRGVTQT